MIMPDYAKPNDSRSFLHKSRLGRAFGGLVTGGPLAAAAAFATPSSQKRPSGRTGGQPAVVRLSTFARTGRCARGRTRVGNKCVKLSAFPPGGVPFTTQASGEAQMGQFGAGLTPLTDTRTVRSCLPGMVLGSDGLCYNRRDIRNSDREWPRGTRPLGTPGEMAALRKAAAFGRRMEGAVKRMQKIGVLKKPRRSTRPQRAPQRLLPATTSIVNVE